MNTLRSLKDVLKNLADAIRETRKMHKESQRGLIEGFYGGKLFKLRHEFRHKHIAYCLLKGTSYESIEKPAKKNEPDMALIKEIQDAYTTNVCAGA